MEALSLWQMLWDIGLLCCVATPTVILLGMIIFLLFKPIGFFDKLGS